jgi:NADPH:quinone reductase-like Zn-dependent oxidoreductase
LTALAAIYAGLRIVPPFIPEAAVEGATSTPPSNVLILGGSSSVGCSAIQLLRLCHPSLQILTTSSSEHHEHLHALGADLCFERKSQTLVKDIQSAITSNKGVDVILDAVGAMSTCPELFDTLKSANDNGRRAYSQVFTGAKVTVPDDVRGTIVFGRMVFQMPGGKEAMHSLSKLNDQEIYKLPNPVRSVGTGLAVIERGLEALRGGVSGVKLVVTVE